ncbi:MAG: hydantoinase B/oxoprolinase family protein [Pigmentiphaga sp.]|nr:hydantoinase B/oxoprolinase family protein [Pigmentiphaga sp.]
MTLNHCSNPAPGGPATIANSGQASVRTFSPGGPPTQASNPDATAAAAWSPATLDILDLRLEGIANRMQRRLGQAAVSAIARDAMDCAAAIFLPDGRVLAQARSLPLLLGSLIPAVAGILRRYPADTLRAGDAILLNDPWHGGTHLPDFVLLSPVTSEGRTAALAVTILHHQDIGGATPGSLPPDAGDIFQEGLRLPPVYWRRAGERVADLHAILTLNSRTPDHLEGDLDAQWQALQLGTRELGELIAELGVAAFAAQTAALITRGAQQTRAALQALPDGDFAWQDHLDPRPGHEPIVLATTLCKRGDTLTIDFTGSSPQQAYPLNATPAAMLAAAFYFMRCLAPSAANNHGCLEPLTLHLPEGTVVNPRSPAPVNARTATVKLACNTLLAAWAQADPDHAPAANASVAVVMAVGGQRADGSHYQFTEIIAGGAGAGPDGDGAPGTSTDVGNARNLPAETLEAIAPVRVEHIGLHADSGGAGRHRGGDGVTRVYRLLEGRAVVTYRGERHLSQAAGAAGGSPGSSSRAWLERANGQREDIASKARFEWYPGDRLYLQTAGGGGWGQYTDK